MNEKDIISAFMREAGKKGAKNRLAKMTMRQKSAHMAMMNKRLAQKRAQKKLSTPIS